MILLTLLVLNLPDRVLSHFKVAVSGLFMPLFGLAGSAQDLAQKAGQAVLPRSQLLQQLEHQRRQNQELQLRLIALEDAERENLRLRKALNWPKPAGWKLKLARIIARDPANWWRTLSIDAGSRDGVRADSPVLAGDGSLVGRVSEVTFTQARVVLLGDPDCRVAVLVQETRDNGIIAPSSSSPLDHSIVDLLYLSRNSPLRPGLKVVTSGTGGVFPREILVGQIVDWRTVGYGLYNEARVSLAARMNLLEEVWVKLP